MSIWNRAGRDLAVQHAFTTDGDDKLYFLTAAGDDVCDFFNSGDAVGPRPYSHAEAYVRLFAQALRMADMLSYAAEAMTRREQDADSAQLVAAIGKMLTTVGYDPQSRQEFSDVIADRSESSRGLADDPRVAS